MQPKRAGKFGRVLVQPEPDRVVGRGIAGVQHGDDVDGFWKQQGRKGLVFQCNICSHAS